MKSKKESISITISQDLLEKVKYEAEKHERSVSCYINCVLKAYLNKKIDKSSLRDKRNS